MWLVLLLDDYRIDDIFLLMLLTQGQGQEMAPAGGICDPLGTCSSFRCKLRFYTAATSSIPSQGHRALTLQYYALKETFPNNKEGRYKCRDLGKSPD